jgi:hypothetical protein
VTISGESVNFGLASRVFHLLGALIWAVVLINGAGHQYGWLWRRVMPLFNRMRKLGSMALFYG